MLDFEHLFYLIDAGHDTFDYVRQALPVILQPFRMNDVTPPGHKVGRRHEPITH